MQILRVFVTESSIHTRTRTHPITQQNTQLRKKNVAIKRLFGFGSVTPMMTLEDDPVSAGFHFSDSKMMLS